MLKLGAYFVENSWQSINRTYFWSSAAANKLFTDYQKSSIFVYWIWWMLNSKEMTLNDD